MIAEVARRIFNPVFFCVNHLFSLVFFFLPGFCTVFKSGQTGNECINNIPSKGMKSVNQESRAAKSFSRFKLKNPPLGSL